MVATNFVRALNLDVSVDAVLASCLTLMESLAMVSVHMQFSFARLSLMGYTFNIKRLLFIV